MSFPSEQIVVEGVSVSPSLISSRDVTVRTYDIQSVQITDNPNKWKYWVALGAGLLLLPFSILATIVGFLIYSIAWARALVWISENHRIVVTINDTNRSHLIASFDYYTSVYGFTSGKGIDDRTTALQRAESVAAPIREMLARSRPSA